LPKIEGTGGDGVREWGGLWPAGPVVSGSGGGGQVAGAGGWRGEDDRAMVEAAPGDAQRQANVGMAAVGGVMGAKLSGGGKSGRVTVQGGTGSGPTA
jgi:hypothetical protein